MSTQEFDLKEYAEFVTEIAVNRKKALGQQFSEVDFFCGAMVAFEFLGQLGKAPGRWIFAPMMGESILDND